MTTPRSDGVILHIKAAHRRSHLPPDSDGRRERCADTESDETAP